MNPTIKLNLKFLKEISWPVVILIFIQFFGWVTAKQAFILYIFLIVGIIGFMKKIIFPKIGGIKFYLFFIMFSSIIGLILYETRNVFRDLYYVLPAVALMILGYYLNIIQAEKVSLLKTMVFCGTIIALDSIFNCLRNISILTSFEEMRGNFDVGVYHVLCSFVIIFAALFTDIGIKMFKKWINYLCFALMLIQLVLCLSRSVWVGAILGCVVVLLLEQYLQPNVVNAAKKIATLLAILILGAILFFSIAPESVVDEFLDKFDKTTEELDSQQEFSSIGETMNNWRGYENQCAKRQWQKATVAEEIFGQGMGSGIYLEYVPYTWKAMVEDNKIPLLHNGYYTILIKGGVIGIGALIWLMLGNVFLGFKLLKKRQDIKGELIIMIALEIIYLVLTAVVRGAVTQNINIVWTLLIGWISADISRKQKNLNNHFSVGKIKTGEEFI